MSLSRRGTIDGQAARRAHLALASTADDPISRLSRTRLYQRSTFNRCRFARGSVRMINMHVFQRLARSGAAGRLASAEIADDSTLFSAALERGSDAHSRRLHLGRFFTLAETRNH